MIRPACADQLLVSRKTGKVESSTYMDGKTVYQDLGPLLAITPVAVEKLASEKFAKIKKRYEAPQTIFSSRLDIFYLPISA